MVVWSPQAQLFPGETWLFGLINKMKAELVGGWRGGGVGVWGKGAEGCCGQMLSGQKGQC